MLQCSPTLFWPFVGLWGPFLAISPVEYFLVGFLAIKIVGQLAEGPGAWQAQMKALENPLYIAFHVLALASVIFVAVRFFRLFPKAQPPSIGPAKPPPGPVIHAMLYVVWLGLTALISLALAGVIL